MTLKVLVNIKVKDLILFSLSAGFTWDHSHNQAKGSFIVFTFGNLGNITSTCLCRKFCMGSDKNNKKIVCLVPKTKIKTLDQSVT